MELCSCQLAVTYMYSECIERMYGYIQAVGVADWHNNDTKLLYIYSDLNTCPESVLGTGTLFGNFFRCKHDISGDRILYHTHRHTQLINRAYIYHALSII